LLGLSFGEAIGACEFVTFDSDLAKASGFQRIIVGQLKSSVGKEIPDRELSAGEKRRLGIWRKPNGRITWWQEIVGKAWHYRKAHGTLPQTGLDLFPELDSDAKLAELLRLSPEDVLSRYAAGIDPITGRFYSDLQAKSWAPAAMNMRVVDDPEQLKMLFPHQVLPVTEYLPGGGARDTGKYKPIKSAWYITIYGESPGSVLYDTIVYMG
jgi:hypothetical protein